MTKERFRGLSQAVAVAVAVFVFVFESSAFSSDGKGEFKIRCVTAESDGKKRDKIEFANVIRKQDELSISMNVQGDSADKQKKFPIVLKLSKAKTYDGNGIAKAVIENMDAMESESSKTSVILLRFAVHH